ncbi:uncharacterized protein LOC129230620 [Uloborus diversus]|uniref:uncharacterized protein LOC129230620 n=1 Tax=Uloborus diversus TaxID=327109 RepID=UPI0024092841|nr:uncharacterized protein LOC129230620 [Uloborus diversus]
MPRNKVRKQFTQPGVFERGHIIGLREAGWSIRRIAQHVGYTDVTVARIWRQWTQHGTYQRQPGSGRPRQTVPREDRRLVRQARNDPTSTVADIQRAVGPSINQPISGRTICRRLHDVGLRSRRPLRRLPLTALHRRKRIAVQDGHGASNGIA